ncbi:hypothetical protein [Jongsikchunia kroppenstedtii]|uniref:hypothetical protein n=1 Tax=Jongsikchunia kroppenstedtii TaxID=1121721 RepID=UPI0003797374|nr:hypothetical protein [Jongsikchunia kroppenstedtii]
MSAAMYGTPTVALLGAASSNHGKAVKLGRDELSVICNSAFGIVLTICDDDAVLVVLNDAASESVSAPALRLAEE